MAITTLIVIGVVLLGFYVLRVWIAGARCKVFKQLSGQVVLITGGNSGVGKYAAIELASKGATVLIACRNPKRAEIAVEEIKRLSGSVKVEAVHLDLSELDSVRQLVQQLKKRNITIDILINNAGLSAPPTEMTKEGYSMTIGVNYISHYLLTRLLLQEGLISPTGRIINVSSMAARDAKPEWLADFPQMPNNIAQFKHYQASKLALVLFTMELQNRLKAQGSKIITVSLHPGVVATNIWKALGVFEIIVKIIGFFFFKTPEQGAQTILHCALADIENDAGQFFDECKVYRLPEFAYDRAAASTLWEKTERILGLDSRLL